MRVCLAAGEEKLKHAVERLLDGVDAVIYVLDYTKLKTESEASLLEPSCSTCSVRAGGWGFRDL